MKKRGYPFWHRPYLGFEIVVVLLSFGTIIAVHGCKRTPPKPIATPTPRPIIVKEMDTVQRIEPYQKQLAFVVNWNDKPLKEYGIGVGESQNVADGVDVYVPLRALGEHFGRRVNWDAKLRRVSFDSETTPRPILLYRGRSYLPQSDIEVWFGCVGRFSRISQTAAALDFTVKEGVK